MLFLFSAPCPCLPLLSEVVPLGRRTSKPAGEALYGEETFFFLGLTEKQRKTISACLPLPPDRCHFSGPQGLPVTLERLEQQIAFHLQWVFSYLVSVSLPGPWRVCSAFSENVRAERKCFVWRTQTQTFFFVASRSQAEWSRQYWGKSEDRECIKCCHFF